jgi:hypothetical protein
MGLVIRPMVSSSERRRDVCASLRPVAPTCTMSFWTSIVDEETAMGLIDDILKALDRIPGWKRVQELPDEVDALARRISELEEKLGGKWPPDVCRFCGARAMRMSGAYGPNKGMVEERWECSKCKRQDIRLIKAR